MSASRLLKHPQLLNIFASQVGSHVSGGVLGLVFWMLAARAMTPEQVGLGAALIAAMALLSMLGLFGIGTLLLERFKFVAVVERWPLFTTGLTTAAAASAIVAAIWIVLSGVAHFDGVLGDLSPATLLLLVMATAVAATCAAFDQAAIGMGASSIQLRRNILASCMRIAFLAVAIALDFKGGEVILVSWMVGLIGSLLASRIRRHVLPRSGVTTRQRWHLVRDHWTAAVSHHGLTLALASGGLMLPVVVASTMPAEETAFFSQAWLLADAALAIPYFLTIALFATAHDLEAFRPKARRTMVLGMVIALVLFGGGALLGRMLLSLFGSQYARESFPLLLILLAAAPVLVIKDHFAMLCRVRGKRTTGAAVMACWTAAELTGAIVGGMFGRPATVCLGWLAASATCSIIVLPVLLRAIRRAAAPPSDSAAADDADRALAEFWNSYVDDGRKGVRYFLRHPRRSSRVLRAIRDLTVLRVVGPSASAGGRAVRHVVDLGGPYGVPARWWGTAALAIPGDATEHLQGTHAQTLRRKIRAAQRNGISCRPVRPEERIDLLKQANAVEQVHRDEQYRVLAPNNDDLLEHDLWLVAEDGDGVPLLLAVIPTDGELATLRYFRTLGAGERYSLSRYIATHAVVVELSKCGVRGLLDTTPSGAQTNGVRHFQRMVGFRYVRLVKVDPAEESTASQPHPVLTDEPSRVPEDHRHRVQAAP